MPIRIQESERVLVDDPNVERIIVRERAGEVRVLEGVPGRKGDPGTGSDANYVHTQNTPATTWNVVHNLGKRPSFVIVDSGGNVVEGSVVYIDDNSLQLSFSSAFGGYAYLN